MDYMFFRNTVPDHSKLSSKLTKGYSSSAAYCCQCTWRSVDEREMIRSSTDMKWTCGGGH